MKYETKEGLLVPLKFFAVISVLIGAFCFAFFGLLLHMADGYMLGILFVSPLIGLLWFERSMSSAGRISFDNFVHSKGGCDRSAYANQSGIAISETLQTLFLSQDQINKTYPLNDVREWRINFAQAGAAGGGSALQHQSETVRLQQEAKNKTGLFVNVKDVDHPAWQIRFRKQDQLEQWNEVLVQSIRKDGNVAHRVER